MIRASLHNHHLSAQPLVWTRPPRHILSLAPSHADLASHSSRQYRNMLSSLSSKGSSSNLLLCFPCQSIGLLESLHAGDVAARGGKRGERRLAGMVSQEDGEAELGWWRAYSSYWHLRQKEKRSVQASQRATQRGRSVERRTSRRHVWRPVEATSRSREAGTARSVYSPSVLPTRSVRSWTRRSEQSDEDAEPIHSPLIVALCSDERGGRTGQYRARGGS